MRILRFSSPRVTDKIPIYHPLLLAGDRHVAVMYGRELHLYDLLSPDEPVARIPSVIAHALSSGCLVVADMNRQLTRYEVRAGVPAAWEATASYPCARTNGPGSTHPARLLLSESGRYLLVESADLARQQARQAALRVYLLDALTGAVIRDFDLHLSSMRVAFVRLPSVEEALVLSAESYMSVQLVACASGQTLHSYTTQSGWDFCHTNYALTADAARLLVFGCVWACPYEARIYDATPWTRSDAPAQTAIEFPLPIVFRQEEVFYDDLILPFAAMQTQDGAVTSVDLVNLAGLPISDSEHEAEVLAQLTPRDRAIYERLSLLPRAGAGLVIRRIDPVSGAVVGWSVAATGTTDERHVHILANHHVMLVNERIQMVDGMTAEVRDEGPMDVSARWYSTLPTSSGDTLVVWWSEGAR
jgi:hypothetical protein